MKSFYKIFAVLSLIAAFTFDSSANAQDQKKVLNLANMSHLTGFVFEDRPLLLPLERNFQVAMLSASSELGRSCGKMEAYAWSLDPSEQDRVNNIFKSTVDRLKTMGYNVEAHTLKSTSSDISVFTADLGNKFFVFLWSAGEYGLVMTLCQTTAPITTDTETAIKNKMAALAVPEPSPHEEALRRQAEADIVSGFSPIGRWSGRYACGKDGFSGATLQIDSLKDKDFKGVFKFYPTERNPNTAEGSFEVSGQFDKSTGLILINPGKWIKQPDGYANTLMVGRFDPIKDALSVYFQGVTGCTSFEASRSFEHPMNAPASPEKKKAPAAAPAPKKQSSAPAKTTEQKPADLVKASASENSPRSAANDGISVR